MAYDRYVLRTKNERSYSINNINNNYDMELSIWKIDKHDKEEVDTYKYQFRFMDDIETFETDTLKNMHFFIGDHIAKVLDKELKNK